MIAKTGRTRLATSIRGFFVCAPRCGALLDRNEQGMPQRPVDSLRQVPLAADVLDQDDLSRPNDPGLSIACRDLHAAVEVDNVLAARGRVPVHIVVALGT